VWESSLIDLKSVLKGTVSTHNPFFAALASDKFFANCIMFGEINNLIHAKIKFIIFPSK